ncbi:hypothetical protein BH24CHL5_BH24CHL5_07570 [soil metagenome]
MIDGSCPWCEGPLAFDFAETVAEQTCPDCLTTWSLEDLDEPELALAA